MLSFFLWVFIIIVLWRAFKMFCIYMDRKAYDENIWKLLLFAFLGKLLQAWIENNSRPRGDLGGNAPANPEPPPPPMPNFDDLLQKAIEHAKSRSRELVG